MKVLPSGTIERVKRDGIRIVIPIRDWGDSDVNVHRERWAWLESRIPRPYWLVLWEKGNKNKVYVIAPEYSDIAMLFKLTWGGA